MQTFLPYPDFKKSAKCLDYKRLGKQRVEAKQILNILNGKAKLNKNGKISWENHPAVKMWKGYEKPLTQYMNTMIQEWIDRGYKNTMEINRSNEKFDLPPWIGDDRLHSSHRSNLLRKNKDYYSKFGWIETNDLLYYWPIG